MAVEAKPMAVEAKPAGAEAEAAMARGATPPRPVTALTVRPGRQHERRAPPSSAQMARGRSVRRLALVAPAMGAVTEKKAPRTRSEVVNSRKSIPY
jgi:hypothetical protein